MTQQLPDAPTPQVDLRGSLVAVGVLTLALGITVAVSWLVFGREAFHGPDRRR